MTCAWLCPRAIALLTCVISTLAAAIALRPGHAWSSGVWAIGPPKTHVFPVPGNHGERGAVGEFGAGRNDGRIHEGFDITAKCGAKLVAVTDGKVIKRGFHARLYGNYILIHSPEDGRNYFYSHLIKPARVGLKEEVGVGQWVGGVGDTGNARGTGCHLHFEIREQGEPINPKPALRKWDRYS